MEGGEMEGEMRCGMGCWHMGRNGFCVRRFASSRVRRSSILYTDV